MMSKRHKIVCIILANIFLLLTYNETIVYAEVSSNNGYQYVYDYDDNEIFKIFVSSKYGIYFYGKHAKSTSKYTYHTTGFVMTLENTNKNPQTIDNKCSITRLEDDGKSEAPLDMDSNHYTTDVYRLDSQDVTTNLVHLLKTQGYSTQGAYKKIAQGVDVYFSNIFEVILRETQARLGSEEYYTYDDIIAAIHTLTGQNWSKETHDLLACYYDNKIHISLSPFFYNVVYVEAKDYAQNGAKAKKLKASPERQEIFFGQYTGMELPSNQELKINKKQYKIKSVEYVYEDGKSNKANPPTTSSGVIEAYHGSKQNATMYVLLETEEKPTPVPSTTPSPTGIPVSSESNVSYFEPDPSGDINLQPIPKTGYDAKKGAPTTEKLYGSIQTSEYLLNIVYEKISGQITYPITVNKTYLVTTKNPSKSSNDDSLSQNGTSKNNTGNSKSNGKGSGKGKGKTKTENSPEEEETYTTTSYPVTQSGTITRSYSYTEIVSIDYYKIKNGTITNETLPGHTITLHPKQYSVPSLTYDHYTGQSQHIKEPSGIRGTINLGSENVSSVPSENLVAIADAGIGQISVRNDFLDFGGKTALSGAWKKQTTDNFNHSAVKVPQKTAQKVLYQDNLLIEKTLKNQTYPSSGTITYEQVVTFHSSKENQLTYPIIAVNDVKIHTPVYCKTMIAHDNNSYLQLMNPDENSIPLILDENDSIGDFTLRISNEGYHSDKPGYGEKNYSKYLAEVDGVPENEVKFPVEMYEDIGNDGKTSNDILLTPDTWTCIGTSEQRFYVPMWVPEGIYTVDVRSVAVNGFSQLDKTEETKNAGVDHYVAIDSFNIQTSGRLYGLTLYDIQDYPLWKDVFREKNGLTLKENTAYTKQLKAGSVDLSKLADGVNSKGLDPAKTYDYTVGINNSVGKPMERKASYTMPLMMGAHPKYKNAGIPKAGYTIRFRMNTNGDIMAAKDTKIEIKPRFYYVDAKGNNRREVDLYYQGTIDGKKYSLIQIGSTADQKNKKKVSVGDNMHAIPKEEITATAKVNRMTNSEFTILKTELYSYDQIIVKEPFRMFSNLGFAAKYKSVSHTEEELLKLKQTYYFSYSLPDKVKAVEKGTDVASYAKQNGVNFKENFWLKDGYLIVNFDITAVDPDGNIRYSYINKENYVDHHYCSMWLMEGGAVKKTGSDNLSLQFLAGDALLFATNETSSDDYSSDGIY